jgi:hypothetical protein
MTKLNTLYSQSIILSLCFYKRTVLSVIGLEGTISLIDIMTGRIIWHVTLNNDLNCILRVKNYLFICLPESGLYQLYRKQYIRILERRYINVLSRLDGQNIIGGCVREVFLYNHESRTIIRTFDISMTTMIINFKGIVILGGVGLRVLNPLTGEVNIILDSLVIHKMRCSNQGIIRISTLNRNFVVSLENEQVREEPAEFSFYH